VPVDLPLGDLDAEMTAYPVVVFDLDGTPTLLPERRAAEEPAS
jgi:hypothetical protein